MHTCRFLAYVVFEQVGCKSANYGRKFQHATTPGTQAHYVYFLAFLVIYEWTVHAVCCRSYMEAVAHGVGGPGAVKNSNLCFIL